VISFYVFSKKKNLINSKKSIIFL